MPGGGAPHPGGGGGGRADMMSNRSDSQMDTEHVEVGSRP